MADIRGMSFQRETEQATAALRSVTDARLGADPIRIDEAGTERPHIQPQTTDANSGRLMTPLSEKQSGSNSDIDTDLGQSRFYGHTCQLYLQYRDATPCDTVYPDDDAASEVKLDSPPLRNVLFQTFWRLQPFSQALVEQERFERGRKRRIRSQWYSDFLEHVMLASASRVSTSPTVRALGARYATLAKNSIVYELEHPNIASLQGFMLLSDFEATRGKNRLGYMYASKCRQPLTPHRSTTETHRLLTMIQVSLAESSST